MKAGLTNIGNRRAVKVSPEGLPGKRGDTVITTKNYFKVVQVTPNIFGGMGGLGAEALKLGNRRAQFSKSTKEVVRRFTKNWTPVNLGE